MKVMYSDSYSEILDEIFEKNHSGRLHSSFETSINLKFGKRLINISSNHTVMPPFGIQTSNDNIKEIIFFIDKDEIIEFNKKENLLLFKKRKLQLKLFGRKYNPKISPIKIDKKNTRKNIMKITDYILENNYENGFGIQNTEFINIIFGKEKIFTELSKKFYAVKEQIKFHKTGIENYQYFLGRGKGLTPSGDDFIIGIMAAMAFSKNGILEELKNELLTDMEKFTTDISCEYLYYSSLNSFSLNIKEFCEKIFNYEAASTEEQNKLYNSFLKLIKNGHTSGMDTLLGILLHSSVLFNENTDELQ